MDFNLKQWRTQQDDESEEQQQPSVKIPKPFPHHSSQSASESTASLRLFSPESNSNIKLTILSDSSPSPSPSSTITSTFPKMGGGSFFSLAQWQELELQALIYRYILAGAAIPPELLQQIKKSLLHSPPYFFHHPLQHYSYFQPALLQTGYWGRAAMDPEPGRCRRTDGKKWRCSRDVVPGQKYCERHVHRGRNRSRKPVEIPTPNPTSTTTSAVRGGGGGGATISATISRPSSRATNGTNCSLSGQSPSADLLNLHNGYSDSRPEISSLLLGSQNEVTNRSDGHILRHFFDDWPRSNEEPDNSAATCLSISMPGNSSDVSLKLSTGDGDEPAAGSRINGREQPQIRWTGGWDTHQMTTSMGGPLAEALRSSTSNSNSSPTSVLHQLPRGSVSETSYVTA